jgi:hypothetical protein
MPTKRKEVQFLDKTVGEMNDEETAKELAAVRKKLLGKAEK